MELNSSNSIRFTTIGSLFGMYRYVFCLYVPIIVLHVETVARLLPITISLASVVIFITYLAGPVANTKLLANGLSSRYDSNKNAEEKLFGIVAVGGTFDELHKGHRALLSEAFQLGREVWIGLSTDEFARKLRKNHEIATYDERLKQVRELLENMNVFVRAKIIPLNDPFGPALESKEIDAIVVSQETEKRAKELNHIRREHGLRPLKVVVINMIPAENHVSISSTRIRYGEIDREGHLLKDEY